ncbi:xanthine dehydrogenase family protein molybdopterin-binding subunit [Azospirillum rugosum]|uniref:Xanthine dehydrogenase YagR molybdenum-binding subunit n=1 Tax=Azospirillum rugosum TaxID=416170 RepID=A0ABS4SIZ8_9PROT|nr:xanthine dehydrogenase family protein molybdopterin-binding subunit [Azospirillum rugosum]MBP2292536.1 xanthine dehydrogenase YagR molybdenum-binding subunit [Azospirillum rugosum]MDQ0526440.1 xanthine dehydrogenase YagR molybdenum-binding subunit [Azospirillum rugosum]
MTDQSSAVIGKPVSRVDGRAKVTGAATYAGEFRPDRLAHAAVVTSSIPAGRIRALFADAAEASPGVVLVATHHNAPRLPYNSMAQRPQVDPQAGDQLRVLQGPEIQFNGQPIAVVVAETLEQATHAAALVRVEYDPTPAVTRFEEAAKSPRKPGAGKPTDLARGDADAALAAAPVSVDATYDQPMEHHNAIEPHVTIAAWDGDRLTLWDKTQWVGNDRAEIAHVFGIPEENIRVVSPFVGGAFGSALRTWPHVTLAAMAAKMAGRPVKLELTRRQLFSAIGFRPRTVQRVALGAEADGRLTAVIHEAVGHTSQYEDYAETTVEPTAMLYSCRNLRTAYRLAPMNINSPCPMRAPGVITGVLALEMAMDELAEAAGIDPLELRLRNYAERDENKDLPWSSKGLRDCYRTAAERFGWSGRSAAPGSMRDGRELVGWGMATAVYPTHRAAASASVVIRDDGTAVVRSAASDMGPGTYTAMTQVAAEALDLPVERVRFELGDTDLPKAPVHGGSITMASVGSAVQAACVAARARMRALSNAVDPVRGADYAGILRRHGLPQVDVEADAAPGIEQKRFSMYAFGAIFAEVRVDPNLGTVRVPRLVGAYGSGRIINPKTARSQCVGGMVLGLGMALSEQSEWDDRFGKVMNANLAEYLVPVNADVPHLDVTFVDEHDPHVNPLGVKGLAEIAAVGVTPAIANAVHHATGIRFRSLPITPDKVLAGLAKR